MAGSFTFGLTSRRNGAYAQLTAQTAPGSAAFCGLAQRFVHTQHQWQARLRSM
jgi:hypothetical protein